ncbi:MAG: ABC transporter permease [Candidatus Izemoplasmatales bacterium]|jgi:oligopeptide transport system permease protein|nr:ABC transporter permease [Candidatus Izemoplasmatales bacterium]MDD3865768.1 ABC transporter permease [Candidatus Izemoplasmatales bacterium]
MMNDFEFIGATEKLDKEQTRPSMTYWKDSWRRLKKNKMAVVGLISVIAIILIAIFGPMFSKYNYSDQQTDYMNIPPSLLLYKLDDDVFVFLSDSYTLILVSEDGELLGRLTKIRTDAINKIYTYEYSEDEEIKCDFSYRVFEEKRNLGIDVEFTFRDQVINQPYKTVGNKTFPLGSDMLGRDMLTRLLYGSRISLIVAAAATLVSLLIGVTYGAISGLQGGLLDNIMMRIIDIIDSIPLLLYVILLMVIFDDNGMGTIIITLGLLYWVGMARLVRGQVLSLKETEYVLAARMLGVSKMKIIWRHLIPNAMGSILVSLTMMIPTAVFTEAFLSFIGLGVSKPQSSWGSMANDGVDTLLLYPYQLLFPSIAIAITMLAFNFLGDGLRSALDPRLRKG